MVARSGKDKKLVLVPSYIVTGLMEIANGKGKSFYNFIAETLEQALNAYNSGQTLKNIVISHEFMELYKSSGARIVSDDLFSYLVEKSYQDDAAVLQDKMYKFGQRCGKNLSSKCEDPIDALRDLIITAVWNLNDVTILREKERVKIRCASPILSMENTMLLARFVDGIVHELGYVTQRQDCAKGLLSFEYVKA